MARVANNEATSGWTDIRVINFDDLTETTDSTAQAINVADIPAGSQVRAVAIKLNTAFDDSGTGSYLNVTIGDDDSANGYITSWEIHTDQGNSTSQTVNGAYLQSDEDANDLNCKLYEGTAKTLKATFTPAASGNAYNLAELTAGSLTVCAEIQRIP